MLELYKDFIGDYWRQYEKNIYKLNIIATVSFIYKGEIILEQKYKFKFSKDVILWCLIIVAGLVYLALGINREALWYDESYSAAIIKHSIPQICSIAGSDSHPPLYFILLKLFTCVFGRGEVGVRLFSVLGVLAISALGAGPVKRIFDKKTGIVYSLLAIIVPINLSMAQEARMYTWASFIVAACGFYGYLAVAEGKRKDWIRFGVCACLAAYTHYYALLAATIINLLILLAILVKKRQLIKVYIITAAIAALCYLPWVYFLAKQVAKVSKDFWISPVTIDTIKSTLIYLFGNKFNSPTLISWICMYLFLALIIWGIVRSKVKGYKESNMAIMAIAVYILTIAAGIAASYLVRPVFVERYSVPVIGILLAAVAYGISLLNKKAVIIAVCAVIMGLSVPQIIDMESKRFNGPMFEVREYMKQNIGKDDIFIHTDEHTFGTFCYYFPDHKQYLYLEQGFNGYSGYGAFAPIGSSGSDFSGFVKGNKNIWLVTRSYSYGENINASLLGSGTLNSTGTSQDFSLPYSWYGVKLEKVTAGTN
ncbi:MAG: glycosyltransferase family 39 protein [Bacillota bacterium]|nr:glycosyltransferase family 39 protein [Bacillota bacterium]